MNQSRMGTPRLLFVAATIGTLVFTALALLAAQGASFAFDLQALEAMRSPADPEVIAGPSWFGPLMKDVTALGDWSVLTLLTLLLAGYLGLRRRWSLLGFLIFAVLGQALVVDALKDLFARPRPDIVPRLAEISTFSFPSGHAASSATVYLLLAAMLAPSLPTTAARIYVAASAMLLALLIGMSRVALGVHYPTDVLAGWSFGLAWTALLLLAARRFRLL